MLGGIISSLSSPSRDVSVAAIKNRTLHQEDGSGVNPGLFLFYRRASSSMAYFEEEKGEFAAILRAKEFIFVI